ncbi:hypothetical protein OTU49_001809 [Cherax quadricarinatus]|uniref:Uncharacterized protein n=1 Tax=Cherax quadricarinatus TaxID=27406 RepID=A0AAW0XCU9_CHEQU
MAPGEGHDAEATLRATGPAVALGEGHHAEATLGATGVAAVVRNSGEGTDILNVEVDMEGVGSDGRDWGRPTARRVHGMSVDRMGLLGGVEKVVVTGPEEEEEFMLDLTKEPTFLAETLI